MPLVLKKIYPVNFHILPLREVTADHGIPLTEFYNWYRKNQSSYEKYAKFCPIPLEEQTANEDMGYDFYIRVGFIFPILIGRR